MAKLFITDNVTGERLPFLRGVLVESLVRAGLPFQDAYLVAQSVRDKLVDKPEITIDALREMVSAGLRKQFGASLADSYDRGSSYARPIMVRNATDKIPFSAGILSRSLQACAIDRADALYAANQIHEHLRKKNTRVIDHVDLRQVIHHCLEEHCTQAVADRYLSWERFRDSGLPLIVLVGGITGTGKSTLTTELAYQLNIVRTQSTDMMREIVRCYLPPDKVPTLSYSSFEAWRGLTEEGGAATDVDETEVIRGFLTQFEVVKHGLEATIHRAVKEDHDLIVDGIHVLPWKLDLDVVREQAIVVPVMLVVPIKKTLGKRLKRRAKEQPERRSSRYLKNLDWIWELQSHLLAGAEEHDIPLIVNDDIDEALHDLLMHISNAVARHFAADG